jgi:hypothetical protein
MNTSSGASNLGNLDRLAAVAIPGFGYSDTADHPAQVPGRLTLSPPRSRNSNPQGGQEEQEVGINIEAYLPGHLQGAQEMDDANPQAVL